MLPNHPIAAIGEIESARLQGEKELGVALVARGQCRKCGCTESRACLVDVGLGRPWPCSWAEEPNECGLGLCTACVPESGQCRSSPRS